MSNPPPLIPNVTWSLTQSIPALKFDALPSNYKSALVERARAAQTGNPEDLEKLKEIVELIDKGQYHHPVYHNHYELYYIQNGETNVQTYEDISHALNAADSIQVFNRLNQDDPEKKKTLIGVFHIVTTLRKIM